MAKKKNGDSATPVNPNERYTTTPADQAKAVRWFQRARELGEKRQFDYAIEYYVSGLEFWPDAIEEACKPLHGCAVARRQTGGKKPGLKDSMKRSLNDKDPKKAFLNSLWLFGHDPDNLGYIEGVARNADRLRAEDAARWASAVLRRALESNAKSSPKQFQTLARLLEGLGDRAAARNEVPFAEEVYQMGVDVLNAWRRRVPKDDSIEHSIKNLSSKLTILKGRYEKSESFRESIQESEEQMEIHDQQRSIQSEERVDELIGKAEAEFKKNPDSTEALKHFIDLLCRRERYDDETKAIGILLDEFKRTENYRWKHLADDIRMRQLGRKGRDLNKEGDQEALKDHRKEQLLFELDVFKERLDRYPTDNRVRFEYGVRNFKAGRFDNAIPLFQTARSDPRNRAACGLYLGRCFFRKGYHAQAVSTLQEAVDGYEIPDDDLAKNMLYWLGRAQEASKEVEAARKTYGRLLQMDYNFGDVRARLDGLKEKE